MLLKIIVNLNIFIYRKIIIFVSKKMENLIILETIFLSVNTILNITIKYQNINDISLNQENIQGILIFRSLVFEKIEIDQNIKFETGEWVFDDSQKTRDVFCKNNDKIVDDYICRYLEKPENLVYLTHSVQKSQELVKNPEPIKLFIDPKNSENFVKYGFYLLLFCGIFYLKYFLELFGNLISALKRFISK